MPIRHYKPWTDEELQYVKQHAGDPIPDIAEALGRTPYSIGNIRNKLGLTNYTNRPLLQSQIELIQTFYPILGSKDTAKIASCSNSMVHRIVNEHNVPSIPELRQPALSPAQLAYIAAYLDADGTLAITINFDKDHIKVYATLSLSFGGTREISIIWIQAKLKQLLSAYHPRLADTVHPGIQHPMNGRTYYTTSIHRQVPLYIVLSAIAPFVIAKANAVITAIQFLQTHTRGHYSRKDYELLYTIRTATLYPDDKIPQVDLDLARLAGLSNTTTPPKEET